MQTQPWDGIATKLMTALATSNPPDVIDIGNTKVLEFARTGALLDLSAQREELAHGGTWLDGLEQPMTYDGGLYAAPAFGAARTVIYNRRMWREAGITTPPTTYDKLCGDLDRVQRVHASDADFSALYLPGQNWFAGLQFLWDAGASPAELRDGQWTATLGSPNGIAGLQAWASFQNRYSSKASRTADTLIPDQAQLLGQQKTSAIIWNASAVTKAVASNPQLSADDFGAFPMPSVSGDGQQPTMMSGSGWAVATRSAAPSLALAWISIATSPAVERAWIVEHDAGCRIRASSQPNTWPRASSAPCSADSSRRDAFALHTERPRLGDDRGGRLTQGTVLEGRARPFEGAGHRRRFRRTHGRRPLRSAGGTVITHRPNTARTMMLAPAAITLTVLVGLPLIMLIVASFTDFNARSLFTGTFEPVGFRQYAALFSSGPFYHALGITILFTASLVVGSMLIGMGAAQLMTKLGPVPRTAMMVTLVMAWALPTSHRR